MYGIIITLSKGNNRDLRPPRRSALAKILSEIVEILLDHGATIDKSAPGHTHTYIPPGARDYLWVSAKNATYKPQLPLKKSRQVTL